MVLRAILQPVCPPVPYPAEADRSKLLVSISTGKKGNSITLRALSSSNAPFEMDEQKIRGQKLMDFPHLLPPHKDVMVGLISALDKRLRSHLLPSSVSVPSDVEYYENQSGASQGSLCINRGLDSSPVCTNSHLSLHMNSIDI